MCAISPAKPPSRGQRGPTGPWGVPRALRRLLIGLALRQTRRHGSGWASTNMRVIIGLAEYVYCLARGELLALRRGVVAPPPRSGGFDPDRVERAMWDRTSLIRPSP